MLDYDISDWDATYKVNLLAPYRIMQKVARSMVHKKSGSIINITSLASEFGFPGNPAYVAFKGALKQLTKAAACDLASYGIRVNSIGPGYIRTNMTNQRTDRTMLGRWGESKDLIGAVIFLSSDAASYITGQDLYVDGGWTAKGL
jgi:NAD(P)-dependent dehydrogenase (short-subunit alcohol dehydrogenase family)